MSKLVLPLVGIGGVGVAGLGGYSLLKKSWETPKEQTFKDKYSHAILASGDDLWATKFKDLKDGSNPTHSRLLEAQTKFKSNDSDENAKLLQKEGCEDIYNSKLEGSNYLQDFRKYCAKLVSNAVKGTWIVDDTANSGKWDTKLNSLKTHNGSLDTSLETLKGKLNANSGANVDANKRGELKNWCDGIKGEIFMGDKDIKFTQAQLYCVENPGT
nr:hypothetical protein [Mycoplasma haemocanis]